MADRLEMQTKDLTEINIQKIAEIFPSCVTETKTDDGKTRLAVDFESLKRQLSDAVIPEGKERYIISWPGKSEAQRLANSPTTLTLRPCLDEHSKFADTRNIYIEGDNLDALKLLRETYLGKVRVIYIDPPYNTGNDFLYDDKFESTEEEYSQISGDYDDSGRRMVINSGSNGKYHTDWLNMIYPRLCIARDLLSENGAIAISIDDNEQANLKKVCDEIFSERNCVGLIPTIMNLKGNNSEFCFAGTHEYVLIYCKNKTKFNPGQIDNDEDLEGWEIDDKGYFKKGATLKRTGEDSPRNKRPYGYFPILVDSNYIVSTIEQGEFEKIYDSKSKQFDDEFVKKLVDKYESEGYNVILPTSGDVKTSWRWSIEKVKQDFDEIIVESNYSLYKKQRPELGEVPTKKPKSVLYKPEYSSGNGTAEIKKLFDGKSVFPHPKPVELIKDLIKILVGNDKEALIVDFFSGSSTTADAIMQLNKQNNTEFHYIAIQLPEPIENLGSLADDATSILREMGKPLNICEIGKERIRRAGKRLNEQRTLNDSTIDIGFRVFKVDSSNMNDVFYDPTTTKKEILDYAAENIKSDRSGQDLLIQVMLELGIELSAYIQEETIADKTIFTVDGDYLIACFDSDVDDSLVTEIAKRQPRYAVFRDSSMSSDSVAINFGEIFKTFSPNTQTKVL